MTEIKFSFALFRAGAIVSTGALSTIDLSFPARLFESLAKQYNADKIRVRDSRGQIWEKEWS